MLSLQVTQASNISSINLELKSFVIDCIKSVYFAHASLLLYDLSLQIFTLCRFIYQIVFLWSHVRYFYVIFVIKAGSHALKLYHNHRHASTKYIIFDSLFTQSIASP